MLNLAAVLTLDNRAFLFGCFGLILEHREEPRRSTRIGVRCDVGRGTIKPRAIHLVHTILLMRPVVHVARWFSSGCYPALLIHFFSGVLIQQHIRRKTTSNLFARIVAIERTVESALLGDSRGIKPLFVPYP